MHVRIENRVPKKIDPKTDTLSVFLSRFSFGPMIMAINFANQNLVRISCDKVENDAHPVQNLISNSAMVRKNGFLAEYYLKPPVTIRIDFFKYHFDLMCLELGLNLRTHRSNGIEIWVYNHRRDSGFMIGKYHQTPDTLTIVNRAFRPNRSFPLENNRSFSNAYYIPAKNWKYCNRITRMDIKITSTLNSTVPCLSLLNIHGKPSNGLNEQQVTEFLNFCQEINAKNSTVRVEKTEKNDPVSLESLAPMEFLDSITCDLMTMPYLLPSGHNIDKTTLDRYVAEKTLNETVDPFTKIPFSDQYKPLFNDVLKIEIDRFIQTKGQSEIDKRNELRERLKISL